MSLLTHAEAVPWGESMRIELVAGHMPPWSVDGPPQQFRNVPRFSGRDLNVLLTWAAGGTPEGDPARAPARAAYEPVWPLGPPDLVLEAPAPFVMSADVQSAVHAFTVSTGLTNARWLRAVDLLPGTASIVRSALVAVRAADHATPRERTLSIWQPGDPPVPLDGGIGLYLPAGGELSVTIHYRKTWLDERKELSDRSAVGLYFTDPPAEELRALVLSATPEAASERWRAVEVIDEAQDAVAVYPDASLPEVHVRLAAVHPGGGRDELISFRHRPGWQRRYWFARPIRMPKGTQLEASFGTDDGAPLPPGATPRPRTSIDPARLRLTVNVVRR